MEGEINSGYAIGYFTIGSFIGSLLIGYLLSRFFIWALGKFSPQLTTNFKIILSYALFLAFATYVAGYGMSQNQLQPDFAFAFFRYLPASVLLPLVEILLKRKKAAVADAPVVNSVDKEKTANLKDVNFCASCGVKVSKGSNFCSSCGSSL